MVIATTEVKQIKEMENIFVYSLFNTIILILNHINAKIIISQGRQMKYERSLIVLVICHIFMNLVVLIFFSIYDDA
jgi:hypothetical protein